eukprot:CAMPEP_0169123550 /NCGR_PEP_ID=MMETSP1015-20121227/33847_1 /TAXON_ID=342587 /ORGANISM="Karlodinium micrum, Strain CCMP2283" /LENGTH=98 /DNA_ID=CAMNT_0009186899 /DNA_START=176 /DNA_END=472 /DNA_ORIENTATION=+
MEESGAPTAVPTSTESLQPGNSYSGFSVTGPQFGPRLKTPPSVQKSLSDPALTRWREEEKQSIHTLRLCKNRRRNPFGGWYEGSTFIDKISGSPHVVG